MLSLNVSLYIICCIYEGTTARTVTDMRRLLINERGIYAYLLIFKPTVNVCFIFFYIKHNFKCSKISLNKVNFFDSRLLEFCILNHNSLPTRMKCSTIHLHLHLWWILTVTAASLPPPYLLPPAKINLIFICKRLSGQAWLRFASPPKGCVKHN